MIFGATWCSQRQAKGSKQPEHHIFQHYLGWGAVQEVEASYQVLQSASPRDQNHFCSILTNVHGNWQGSS